MADHDCVAYSNTAEIFFAQQDEVNTAKSFNIVVTLLEDITILDIQTKVQVPMLCNKLGHWVVL